MARAVILLASLAYLGVALPSAGADGETRRPSFRERLEGSVRGLASPRPERRRVAFGCLRALVAENGPGCGRAVRSLADVLRRRGVDDQAEAVGLLARIPTPRARSLWLGTLRRDAHPTVWTAAVAATAFRRQDPTAHRALLDIVRSEREAPARRALALEALGALGGPAARLVLARPLSTDEPEAWVVASGRALGLGRLGGEGVPEALADLLSHPHAAPRVHAWEALRGLTRQDFGLDANAWRRWLAGRTPGPAAARPRAAPADRYRAAVPVHVPRYYGVPIDHPRSHVVFCLDVSQSMYGDGITQARGELARTLQEFPSRYAFDVIAFNENVQPFAGELLPAHPVVKARVLDWLAQLETISYTNLYDAVETAFGYASIGKRARETAARLDAVFLLSDGAPNRGRYRKADRVVKAIAELSRGRIPVHGVAAGEEVFPLLKQIAAATGGRFVDAFEFD